MPEDSPYFSHHVFICMNQREEGRECCADKGSHAAQKYLKSRVKELGLAGPGQVRVNQSGCLDRCEEGPVLVVYPEGTWYTYVDNEDLDEIIEEHLVHGRVVDRLKI